MKFYGVKTLHIISIIFHENENDEQEIERKRKAHSFFFVFHSFTIYANAQYPYYGIHSCVAVVYISVHKNEYIHSNWPHRSAQQNRHLPAYETACIGMLNAY